MTQRWEYKWISVARSVGNADWSFWFEDDRQLSGPVQLASKIRELGAQGWELVSVAPISNHATTSGTDFAGYTSQMTYFFKRPLPPDTPPMLPKL